MTPEEKKRRRQGFAAIARAAQQMREAEHHLRLGGDHFDAGRAERRANELQLLSNEIRDTLE